MLIALTLLEQATTKERKASAGGGAGGGNSKKRKKKEEPEESEGGTEVSVSESASTGSSAKAAQAWDWHKCFVHDCKRISDRYLKEIKDRGILWVHTCASHRTMQDKARKAWRGKENLVGCHVCYGLNGPSSETWTAGKLGTGLGGTGPTEEFVMCKACKFVQERINTEGGERKVARTEAMDLKRELWQKLAPKLQRADRAAAPPVSLPDLGLTEEGDAEDESGDKDADSAAQARQSEPTSEVEISRDAPPAGLPPPASPAPATPAPAVQQDIKPHIVATPVSVPSVPATPVSAGMPAPSPAPSSAVANHTPVSNSAAAIPVAQGSAAQDVAADREAEAIRLREEMVALIESHLRKGGGVRGGGAEEVEEEVEEEEELEMDEAEEEDFDERPRTGTGKAKSRK